MQIRLKQGALIATAFLMVSAPTSGQISCQPDHLELKSKQQVIQAAEAFGIAIDKLSFQSCTNGAFNTAASGEKVTINYPASISSFSEVVGAITHELAHAYQIRSAGGLRELRQLVGGSSERIELGADFLAGYVFRHFMTGVSRADFQTSLELVGQYETLSGQNNGTPEERTAAFRMGYYRTQKPLDLGAANRYFQRDGFGRTTGAGQ